MKYFAIFNKNLATIFQLQWNIGNIPDIFLQYSALCGFIHIHFLRNQTKKIYNRAKELHCDATVFVTWFCIAYLPKKLETEKWPKAANSPLHWIKKFVESTNLVAVCHFCG